MNGSVLEKEKKESECQEEEDRKEDPSHGFSVPLARPSRLRAH